MFVKEANGLPELKMISPLLTNMEVVKCISVRGGTSVYIVKSTKSNQSYYLKHICIPESQKQVDALMFTGAAATVEDAQNYYKQVAADYQAELETLEKLSASPNIGCYRSYQRCKDAAAKTGKQRESAEQHAPTLCNNGRALRKNAALCRLLPLAERRRFKG